MINKQTILVAIFSISCAPFSFSIFAAEPIDNEALKVELQAEAVSIVQQFGGTLKPKLVAAIQSGGFEHAIDVCSIEAPAIAAALSEETGWSVKRVSLKPRNTISAAPDDYERQVLEQFNTRQVSGESPTSIASSEIVGNQYRFMKAQPVEAICLNCHGENIAPAVREMIREHFPDDAATGYSLGEIRGAFSVTKGLVR